MLSREIKRFSINYGKYFEPFLVLGVLVAFSLPIFAVVSMTPSTRQDYQKKSVLGANQKAELKVENIGGAHEVINNEVFLNSNDSSYQYSAVVQAHAAGHYSKPILSITNNTGKEVSLLFSGDSESSTGSRYGVIIDETNYVFQDENGDLFSHTAEVQDGETLIVYLSVKSDQEVFFGERVNVDVRLKN